MAAATPLAPGDGQCRCQGVGPDGTPLVAACGQTVCGEGYVSYLCSDAGWSSVGDNCIGNGDGGPLCGCRGVGPEGAPITVPCGQTACGEGYVTYACEGGDWSPVGRPCTGNSDGGPTRGCHGFAADGSPLTATYGQTVCGEGYVTYTCEDSGWSFVGTPCIGNSDAGPTCGCRGVGPEGSPITVACGQTACGMGYVTYACEDGDWSLVGTSCAGNSDGGPTCGCHGVAADGSPLTATCGQIVCGEGYVTYACEDGGWSFVGTPCIGNSDAGPTCGCRGVGPDGSPLTVTCGRTGCGIGYVTYGCEASGWSLIGDHCTGNDDAGPTCVCEGFGPESTPLAAQCGQTVCGIDYATYTCHTYGWSRVGDTCIGNNDAGPAYGCLGVGPDGVPLSAVTGQVVCGLGYMTYSCTSAGSWVLDGEPCSGNATLSTSKSRYVAGESILVRWAGLTSNSDTVVIAPLGSSSSTVLASCSTGSGAGSLVFSGLDTGRYEARLFDSSWRMRALPVVFTIAPLTVATDKPSYAAGEPVVVTWSSTVVLVSRIVIAPWNTNGATITASADVSTATGTHTFDGIPSGAYDLWLVDANAQAIPAGVSFIVTAPVVLSVERPSYFAGESLVVHWTGCQSYGDLIGIGPANSSAWDLWTSAATNGAGSGQVNLPIGGEGSFVARFFDDLGRLAATTEPFTIVAAPTLTTDASFCLSGDPVLASWSGAIPLEGSIVVAPAGSPLASASFAVSGATTGNHAFTGLPVGDYELRFIDTSSSQVPTAGTFFGIRLAVTNKARYATDEPVVVVWRDVPVAEANIVIAPVGSDVSDVIDAFAATASSGTHAFAPVAAGVGVYEVRVIAGGQLIATGASFAVVLAASVWAEHPTYFTGQDVVIHWTGWQSPGDWIGIGPAVSSGTNIPWAAALSGQTSGSYSAGGWSEGAWGVWFFDDTGQIRASAAFTVVPAPTLTTDKPIYVVGDPVLATWSAAVAMNGRIVIAPAGSPAETVSASVDVSGVSSGSQSFAGLPANDYELRYFDTSSAWIATVGFRVATVGTDKLGYGTDDPVVVTWNGSSPIGSRIVVAPAGSGVSVVTASVTISPSTSGSYSFHDIPAGDYEVRFFDDAGNLVATTATFSVYARFVADRPPYGSDDFIAVSWRDCPADAANRIVIAPDGSSDDTVTSWVPARSVDGGHAFGPLGPGTYRARYFADGGLTKRYESGPIQIVLRSPASFLSVSAGEGHSCGVTVDHAVRCWGDNGYGQIGDGTTTFRSTAVTVSGLADAVSVSTGAYHSCALLQDRTLRCWGHNWAGQLGDGTYVDSTTPVTVQGVAGAVAVSAGTYHTCALLTDGGVRCWGVNDEGELGSNAGGDVSATALPVDGISNAIAVSAGEWHSCALLSDGTIRCWGSAGEGQLGDGGSLAQAGRDHTSTPNQVLNISSAVAVTAGGRQTCALLNDGTARCWGCNYSGQLGDGTTNWAATPVDVTGVSNATSITTRGGHTCARLGNGSLRCWGSNGSGELGDGTLVASSVPVEVAGIATAVAITAGTNHTCALLADATARCWGYSITLGGVTSFFSSDLEGFSSAQSIAGGGGHVCASFSDGRVRCWGGNWAGQLGDGTTTQRNRPELVSTISTAAQVQTGLEYSCALLSDGHVRCWGSNWTGQLGDGTGTDSPVPVEVAGLSSATSMSTGYYHACAILADGKLRCWGLDDWGQLGDPADTTLGAVVRVSAGVYHSCAVRSDGSVWCWGANWYGQLGPYPTADGSRLPVQIPGVVGATLVATGEVHSCALLGTGTVWCWGYNGNGQLGDGSTTDRRTPVQVSGIDNAVAVQATGYTSCALLADGSVRCWGYNGYAQLGDGSWTDRRWPVDMGGISQATAIGVGYANVCVLQSSGKLRCWGDSSYGALGDGMTPYSLNLVIVLQ